MIQSYINFYSEHQMIFYIFLSLVYLCIGSFLNVIIVRLPKIIYLQHEKSCHSTLKIPLNIELPSLNIVTTPSHCSHCDFKIPFWHNIPVLSFLILRGRCANCYGKISWLYPFIEILTMISSLVVVNIFGYNLQTIYILLFVWIIICLSFIDIKTKLLPDCLTISLLWLGLLANINDLYTILPHAIYGAIGGYLSLWIIINLYSLLTGKVGMGEGDFKLFAALGAWFGVLALPKILVIACALGIFFGLIYLIGFHKSKNTPIAFGPFLGIAGILFLFRLV
jgi:leader peptidase (prepilin peptidase)/N-methyltransferase